MELTPAKPRNRKIGGITRNYAWSYVPGEPFNVPDEVGRVLIASGKWKPALPKVLEVAKDKYQRLIPKSETMSTNVDTVESTDDGTQSDTSQWGT